MHNNLLLANPAGDDKLYVEDVFSTWLYTGNGSTQTITNGIDLAGKGGLVWLKSRAVSRAHHLFDTTRGVGNELYTNSTGAQANYSHLTSFNSDGFALSSGIYVNNSAEPFASWTFRKAPKFFDCVTWTGNGASNRQISHSLGVEPGMIIVKCVSSGAPNGDAANWTVYHRSVAASSPESYFLLLNSTAAYNAGSTRWNNTAPTATNFTVGSSSQVNWNGETYVAYLFAHDTTADGVIQCGSYTGNGSSSGPTINLGWEPQYILVKSPSNQYGHWHIFDTTRGMSLSNEADLLTNSSTSEDSMFGSTNYLEPTATGFRITSTNGDVNISGYNHIYLAIRRGPMRVPTDATKVFAPAIFTGDNSTTTGQFVTTGFPVDLALQGFRNQPFGTAQVSDRLRGITGAGPCPKLLTYNTNAEGSGYDIFGGDSNIGVKNYGQSTGYTMVNWLFRRAPGFFDVVNIRSNGTGNQTISHNLGVVPEMIITKNRTNTGGGGSAGWWVAHKGMPGWDSTNENDRHTARLEQTAATAQQGYHRDFTNTTFRLTSQPIGFTSGENIIAYLFASCPGVSKVGSFTGNGAASQTIDCGFTNGARFVMIKRTDGVGSWYVWDSARGIISANDPYLQLNSTAAELTNSDDIDPTSVGFIVNKDQNAGLNENGWKYIYLAIA